MKQFRTLREDVDLLILTKIRIQSLVKTVKSNTSSQDMEDRILDGWDRLLAHYGYRKITMDDLASEVGIGKGSIYLYFRSKEDLLYSHIDRVVRQLIERLERVLRSTLSPGDKLREMIVLRVIFRFDAVQHFQESLSEMFRDFRAGVLERREHYFKEEAKLFEAALRQGQRAGVFRKADCFTTANAILAATNSLLPFHLSARELGKRQDIEKTATLITNLLLDGLLQRNRK
jgi:AcrR family transcriptional regulator